MKRLVVPSLVALALAISSSAALADAPTRVFSPFSNDSFSAVCSFTVDRVILVNNSYRTTFSDGTQLYTGTFKERISNETTGKYIDFNGSGPITLVYHADGTVTETDFGPQFERPTGRLLLTTGQVVWTYDSSFNVLSYAQSGGTSRDVCTILA